METLLVRGGHPLRGEVRVHGAKNSVLPILAACVLCPEPCTVSRCPEISDVAVAEEILRHLGCTVRRRRDSITVDAAALCRTEIPPCLMGKMRASVNFLGALLGRMGTCELSLPGGCDLGSRPIDFHIAALEALGVEWEQCGTVLRFRWPHRRGGRVRLPYPSVGATENLLLAAVTVPEPVTVCNAAREPEITDLCRFLRKLGARVEGEGGSILHVCGGRPLHGADHAVLPDRIETATYLAMTAGCGGQIRLTGTDARLLTPVLTVLERAGCRIEAAEDTITLARECPLRGVGAVETAVYPGFPTDAQAPVMAALLRAAGESRWTETVFCSRFSHVPQLRKFGASIRMEGSTAAVTGVESLHGAEASATDLRGGAGVLLAAMMAEGTSVITCAERIRRGYADLGRTLCALGAEVKFTV